jgi:hypothetical protein
MPGSAYIHALLKKDDSDPPWGKPWDANFVYRHLEKYGWEKQSRNRPFKTGWLQKQPKGKTLKK